MSSEKAKTLKLEDDIKKLKTEPISKTIFFVFDIEADGDSPVYNSMLSIGIVIFDESGKELESYQSNIKPLADRVQGKRCMEEFWNKNPEAWKFVNTDAKSSFIVMQQVSELYQKYKDQGCNIDWVADPAAYDWQWLKAYMEIQKHYNWPTVDIGYTATCLDTIEQLYWKITDMKNADEKIKQVIKDNMAGNCKHTHNPVDDARRAGRIYFAMQKNLGLISFKFSDTGAKGVCINNESTPKGYQDVLLLK